MSTTLPAHAALNVTVGESVASSLARARSAMETLQRGKTHKPHLGVGFAQVGQMPRAAPAPRAQVDRAQYGR